LKLYGTPDSGYGFLLLQECDICRANRYKPAMKILLTNDDGYFAPGIQALYDALNDAAELTVVAPAANCSGCSNALTLRKPINTRTLENGFVAVEGTSADCVHLAITGMLDFMPDMVISGINNGPNFGDDVIYSGTVAAVIEARFLRLPGMAVSLAGEKLNHYETAARVARELVQKLEREPLDADVLLNINVPDIPYEQLRGMEITRLGRRSQSEPIVHINSGNYKNAFQIGRPGKPEDAGEGTDFDAVDRNRISISPITLDMTHYDRMATLHEWARPGN
jgi:5'-nucleotidase